METLVCSTAQNWYYSTVVFSVTSDKSSKVQNWRHSDHSDSVLRTKIRILSNGHCSSFRLGAEEQHHVSCELHRRGRGLGLLGTAQAFPSPSFAILPSLASSFTRVLPPSDSLCPSSRSSHFHVYDTSCVILLSISSHMMIFSPHQPSDTIGSLSLNYTT